MSASRRMLVAMVTVVCALVGGLAWSVPGALASYSFGGSFGEAGSGTGQFKEPAAVAVNEASAGDVYVLDKGNARVQWFSATGVFLGQFNGEATPARSFVSPEAIAVDNSTSPSKGDVYVEDTGHGVIDKFTPSGEYLGQITTGAGGAAFGELVGVSVNLVGEVWVFQHSKEVDNYTAETNTFIASREDAFGNNFEGQASFAVDAENDFYVSKNGKFIGKDTSSGEPLVAEFGPGEPAFGAAVDLESNNVYVSYATFAGEFNKEGASIEEFGAGHLTGAAGLAVNTANERVYVADMDGNTVVFFNQIPTPPAVEAESSLEVAHTSAILRASVNPKHQSLSVCQFQYALKESLLVSSPSTTECFPAAAEIPPVSSGVPVAALLEGLQSNTTYYYRLTATNPTGTTEGASEQFLTLPDAPAAQTGEAIAVAPYSATLTATVNPGSAGHAAQDDTTYQFQYSADESFSSQTPLGDAGEGSTPLPVQAHLENLEPDTTYHYRILASNNNDKTPQQAIGEPHAFTTVALPPILTGAQATEVTPSTALLSATLQARGLPTRWELQLGTTPETLQPTAAGNSSSPESEQIAIAIALEHLQPGVTYYYRLTATNPDGTTETPEATFTTLPGLPPAQAVTSPTSGFPILGIPPNIFPTEARVTSTTPKKKIAKCPKGRKRDKGRCVKVKRKGGGHAKRGRRR
jgi:hypothetical protein